MRRANRALTMQNCEKVKVYLVDDHPLVRESLSNLVNEEPDLVICGEADEAERAISEISVLQPKLAIIDISLQQGNGGLELIKAVKTRVPYISIIALSMHDEKLYAERCIRAGALAYVMKRESSKRIMMAIREALAGRVCVSEPIAAALTGKQAAGRKSYDQAPIETLSDRELEVFKLLGKGLSTREAAKTLNISVKTIQTHCGKIKQKLHLSTATELLMEAFLWRDQNTNWPDSVA
jgi:DNA-binding NarL/FixJ family response regulator